MVSRFRLRGVVARSMILGGRSWGVVAACVLNLRFVVAGSDRSRPGFFVSTATTTK